MHDRSATLRQALLLALGLGGCAANDPGAGAGGGAAEPVPQKGELPAPGGYVREADGSVHRAGPEACSADNPLAACSDPGAISETCKADSACTERPHGRCVQDSGQAGPYCRCDYACANDGDCKDGEVCVCGEAIGGAHHSMCVPATCKADSECAPYNCALSVFFNGCFEEVAFACRGGKDTCTTDADCGPIGEGAPASRCALDRDAGAWTCQAQSCMIGRPLIVDGASRTAATVTRSDWQSDLGLAVSGPPAVAAAISAHWAEVAALEHASVASFARFTLELLALGAPPELLAQTQLAALDEVEHARIAWSLASLWAGRAVGPGPLAVAGVAGERPLPEVVASLVREGCVGETLGVGEAEMLADGAEHPVLRVLVTKIADDERRHAALAWRTLVWLLGRHGEVVRVAALTAVAEVEAELRVARPGPERPVLAPGWGLCDEASRLACRRATFEMVVRPVLQAVLGRSAVA